jgi:uncharacterized protein with PQ loop repeat
VAHYKSNKNLFLKLFDDGVYLIGFFGIIVFLPQLTKVWLGKNVEGLSFTSWAGMTLGSIVWLIYGILHKQKPLIVVNIMVAFLQLAIVIGIITYSK